MSRFSGRSGANARKWRQSIAEVARNKKDYVRTLKFPLEIGSDAIDFAKISELFEVTEGTSQHSLFGLLVSTHLAGFRFFSSAGKNNSFRSLGKFDVDFFERWKSEFALAPELSPSSLVDFATRPRRKRNGVPKEFSAEKIVADLGFKASQLETDETAAALIREFASQLTTRFSSWTELNNGAENALKLFDDIAASQGIDLPQVGGALAQKVPLKPPECSIAFDGALLHLDSLQASEYSLHQVVAQKMRMLRQSNDEEIKASKVQLEITTGSNNALSWLFGTGFLYWRNTGLDQIMRDFHIPISHLETIRELKGIYENVPLDTLFEAKHFADFRSSVGGKIDSWVANYVKQINDIEDSLNKFEDWEPPSSMSSEDASGYFKSVGLTYQDMLFWLKRLGSLREAVLTALERLQGKSEDLPTDSDIDVIEQFSREVSGLAGGLQSVKNAINQELESDEPSHIERAKNCDFSVPKWLKKLPKVNKISGGLPDVSTETKAMEASFRDLRDLRKAFVSSVLENASQSDCLCPLMVSQIRQEKELLEKRGENASDAENQAKRNYLNRLCKLAGTGSATFRQAVFEKLAPLIKNPKDLNRILFNQQGSLYLSPYSRSRHEAVSLNENGLSACDPFALISDVLEAMFLLLHKESTLELYRDVLRLENLQMSIELARLEEAVPTAWLNDAVEQVKEHCNVPASMAALFNAEEISRSNVIKLCNLVTNELGGLLAKASRESFITRTGFLRVGVNELYWVPKKLRPWSPPAHVEKSNAPIGHALQYLRALPDVGKGPIDASQAVSKILGRANKKIPRGSPEEASILRQMPHDWYLDLKIKGFNCEEVTGFGVDKVSIKHKSSALDAPVRLIGPSAYKSVVDSLLVDPNLKIGEHNIMFVQHYQQSVTLDADLGPEIKTEPREVTAELALTVTDARKLKESDTHPLGNAVIGIDLGEAGIGYAVFLTEEIANAIKEGRTPEPMDSGGIPIPSIRGLIRQVKRHRKRIQPNQRFRQGYSTALQELREGALGDVRFVIDELCARHQGFPVLESSVTNLAAGAKQLPLIYDKIVHTYWFSDVDAHKMARKHHWAGAENWEHPTLFEKERKRKQDGTYKPTGKARRLKLYPGSAVHPARTSQICSKCERNPYKEVKGSVADSGEPKFKMNSGIVTLANGYRLKLLQRKDPDKDSAGTSAEMRAYKRKKETVPYTYPYKGYVAGSIGREDLERRIRQQLRRPQTSKRSKDTTQSAYSCVFEDCGWQMHADANAAINIVRKWISDRAIH